MDYIFRWLGITFLPGYREASAGLPVASETGSGKELSGEESPGEVKPAAMKAGGQTAGPGLPKTSGTKAATAVKAPANGAAKAVAKNGAVSNGASANGNGAGHSTGDGIASLLERAGVAPKWDLAAGASGRSDQFASFQVDAPACDNCGAITVRNGNCYLCHNCGNSMGCS